MLRPNRLFGSQITNYFKKIGGHYYTNCFTEAPDTPRSLATFYSGLSPHLNGCNTRSKWPGSYLKNNDNIFTPFIEKNLPINVFANPRERSIGMFPNELNSYANFNLNMDLNGFLKEINLLNDQLVYIALPDFHWAIDDYGANTFAEQRGYKKIYNILNLIQSNIDYSAFDAVFHFSDHGFKLLSEYKAQSIYDFVNFDRTNVLFHAKLKNEYRFLEVKYLCNLKSFKDQFVKFIMKSSFSLPISDYILVEDYYKISPGTTNSLPNLWAYIDKNKYIIFDSKKNYHIISNKNNDLLNQENLKIYKSCLENNTFYNRNFDLSNSTIGKVSYTEVPLPVKYSDGTKRPSNISKKFIKAFLSLND